MALRRRLENRRTRLHVYLGIVIAAGAAVLVVAGLQVFNDGPALTLTTGIFVALLYVTERFPLRVISGDDGGEVTTSWTFAYALILLDEPGLAVVGLASARLFTEIWRRKPPLRIAFKTARLSFSLFLGAITFDAISGTDVIAAAGTVPPVFFAALLLAGSLTVVLNNALAGTALAIDQGASLGDVMRQDLGALSLSTDYLLLTLAPVLVIMADHSLLFLPAILLTVLALYRSSRSAMERDFEARHDSLTGLPNRRRFHERTTAAIEEAARTERRLALMILDLDRFKQVNDVFGHHIGDVMLHEIATRLAGLSQVDVIARLGGDEFAVLVSRNPTRAVARGVARQVLTAVDEPLEIQGCSLATTASVGIAMYPEHGHDYRTLMRSADAGMYAAKQEGSGLSFACKDETARSHGRISLLGELERALSDDELVLHFQPQIDTASDDVRGVEALVRWQHPDVGLIPPGEFIQQAEHTEFIRPLTTAVLDQALAQAVRWREAGFDVPIAVNLSMRSLQDLRFPNEVADLLDDHGLPASSLAFEITENAVMADSDQPLHVLREVAGLGVRLSLDDFGTGYSSLIHLRALPIRELKIDRSFVLGMLTSTDDASIVKSIIDLARSLSLEVVAEGVEDLATLAELQRLGCRLVQGHLLGPPARPERLLGLLTGGRDVLAVGADEVRTVGQ